MKKAVYVTLAILLLLPSTAMADDIDYLPPPTYYSGATGTGATLKTQLESAMSAGHIQRNYGQFRNAARILDADPNNSSNILLAYNRASVPFNWDGGSTWNREHVWPQSRQPGSADNSSTGNLGDHHALRPADPGINSARGNKPFAEFDTTGPYADLGSEWYPGDDDIGDIARSLFYSDTRYGSTGISLVFGTPGFNTNEMGDLVALVYWHYRDVPDDFERRRNQAAYSSGLNPFYYTNNRNAYVDHPEFVWSVYVDQDNDSQLYVGGSPAADGGSSLSVDLGSVIVGAGVPANQNVTLNRNGNHGTYYEVTPSGDATSSVTGRYNAFAINNTGSDSTTLSVGLSTSTAAAGQKSGSVLIDNLDITTGAGLGMGDQDADDTINVTLDVLDHSEASFDSLVDDNSLLLDFGSVLMGATLPTLNFDIFNLESTAGFTADLELDSILGSGDTSALTTDLTTFTGGSALEAGSSNMYTATLDTSTVGTFSATYTLSFSDEDIDGATTGDDLILTLTGEVTPSGDADFDGSGEVDGVDFLILQRGYGSGTTLAEGDANDDNQVNGLDLAIFEDQYGQSSLVSATQTVPEPHSLLLIALGLSLLGCRRI